MTDEVISEKDDFLDSRFDPAFKVQFQNSFGNEGESAVQRDFNIPIIFEGQFDPKVKTALENMINAILNIAYDYELKISDSNPQVTFFTPNSWDTHQSKKENTALNLPASAIEWKLGDPYIQIIVPKKIDTLEILIKTVRLLFSNLFGKVYLDELIKNGHLFKSTNSSSIETELEEKTRLCRFADSYSMNAQKQFLKLGSHIKNTSEKQIELGKKNFFKEVFEQLPDIKRPEFEIIDSTFLHLLASAHGSQEKFFDEMSDKHTVFQSQIGLVLPHEIERYNRIRERRRWEYFDSFLEKLRFVTNSINDLIESFEIINSDKELEDFSSINYWLDSFDKRLLYLKRKGLVKLFLIEDARLSDNQKKDQQSFPLWIWQKKLFRNYPKNRSPEQLIKTITSQYKNSIYQKIFEATFRSINCLKVIHKSSPSALRATADFKRLNALMTVFSMQKPIIEDLFTASRLIPQMATYRNIDNTGESKKSKGIFYNGWSYFISFALIHQYYVKKEGENGIKGKKFEKIIETFVRGKMEDKQVYQVAYLFYMTYKNSGYKLLKSLKILSDKSKALEFFVYNIDKIMQRNQPVNEIIESHATKLLAY